MNTSSSINEVCNTVFCDKCDNQTALVGGTFFYEPDDEPYVAGVVENSKIESGDLPINGYKCEHCEHIQGLWHE